MGIILGSEPNPLGLEPNCLGRKPKELGCEPNRLGKRAKTLGSQPNVLAEKGNRLVFRPKRLPSFVKKCFALFRPRHNYKFGFHRFN